MPNNILNYYQIFDLWPEAPLSEIQRNLANQKTLLERKINILEQQFLISRNVATEEFIEQNRAHLALFENTDLIFANEDSRLAYDNQLFVATNLVEEQEILVDDRSVNADLPPNYDLVIARGDSDYLPSYEFSVQNETYLNKIKAYELAKTANNNKIKECDLIIAYNEAQINTFNDKKINVFYNFLLFIFSGGKYNKNKTIMADIEQKKAINKNLKTKIKGFIEDNTRLEQAITHELSHFTTEVNQLSEQNSSHVNLNGPQHQLHC